MLKSISIHQRHCKGIVKSNFVTSCLSFRGSILARKWLRMLEEENGPECLTKKWLSMPN